jgi:hypothetical protein
MFIDYVYVCEIWCVDSYEYTRKLCRKYCFSVRNYTMFRRCYLTLFTSDKFNDTKVCKFRKEVQEQTLMIAVTFYNVCTVPDSSTHCVHSSFSRATI